MSNIAYETYCERELAKARNKKAFKVSFLYAQIKTSAKTNRQGQRV